MNTPIAEEYRQQAEALAKTLRNYLPYNTSIADADTWEKQHAIPLIATALQAAADELRGDKLVVVFNTLCKIKNLGNDEHMSVARGLAQSGLSVFEFDKNEKPVLSHTPRNAQQSEAAETVRGEDKWQSIMNFPKDAKTGSHWEVMAILDGDWRHLIARWFGDSQGFSTIGVCGFEVTHFRSARETLDEINSFGK